jgi:hypothetical protein
MVGFVCLAGYAPVRVLENTLTTYRDQWLNFLDSCPVASLD